MSIDEALKKLDPGSNGIVQKLMTQAQNKPVYLTDLISELLKNKTHDEKVNKRVLNVLSNHYKSMAWESRDQTGNDFRFDFVNLILAIPVVLARLGLTVSSPSIVYLVAARSLEFCQAECDKAFVRALHDAQLGVELIGNWSESAASPAPMGITLTGMAASWDAPPLGELAMVPQHVEDVLVQLFGGYQVPLLVGEPGVGKSTIARQIAYMLFKKDERIPKSLHSKKLLSISRGDIVGGTKDRGELENRTQRLLELCDRRGGYIVFLDEIHALFDHSAEAKIIGNMLKGPMAEGKLRCFGATTRSEFAEYLSHDPPLVERFRLVDIPEPAPHEVIQSFSRSPNSILSAAELDGWKIEEDAIEAAVKLSSRYMPLQKLPRKAASLLRTTVAECQYHSRAEKRIHAKDVRYAISKLVRIPPNALVGSLADQTQALAKDLKEIVLGHNVIIEEVANTLVRREAMKERGYGLGRPLASFLFFGPSGNGKKLLAKAIGTRHLIFGAREKDCVSDANVANYTGESGSNRFRGSPPGFVGYGPVPPIYSDPRTSPRRVILIEGLESSDGLAEFIEPILTDGIGYDGAGKVTDFSGCVVVLVAHFDDQVMKNGDAARLANFVDKSFYFDNLDAIVLRNIGERLCKKAESDGLSVSLDNLMQGCRDAASVHCNFIAAIGNSIH